MKFIIDNALSPFLAGFLNKLGHDAIHVRDVQMHDATDEMIFELAIQEKRIIVSADTDFGTLLVAKRKTAPSVILFRKGSVQKPEIMAKFLEKHLPMFEPELESGCIIVITDKNIRMRSLPLA